MGLRVLVSFSRRIAPSELLLLLPTLDNLVLAIGTLTMVVISVQIVLTNSGTYDETVWMVLLFQRTLQIGTYTPTDSFGLLTTVSPLLLNTLPGVSPPRPSRLEIYPSLGLGKETFRIFLQKTSPNPQFPNNAVHCPGEPLVLSITARSQTLRQRVSLIRPFLRSLAKDLSAAGLPRGKPLAMATNYFPLH